MSDAAEVKFDYAEWKSFLEKLNNKLKTTTQSRTFAGIISATVFGDIIDHFDKEMGPDGKWTPWSLSYAGAIQGRIAFRTIRGKVVPLGPYQIEEYGIKPPRKPGKILQATGKLRNTITPNSNKYRVASGVITFFNNAKTKSGFPYAAAHDEGGPKLPQRRFMWLSDNGMEKIIKLTEKWLAE